MSKKSLRRERVAQRLAKAGEARDLIRTHGDATDRLAWRPAALPALARRSRVGSIAR